jgi:hypothetical protein
MPALEANTRDLDRAVGRIFEEVDAPKEGGFPGTRTAEDHDHLATVDDHVDASEHFERTEVLVQRLDANDRFAHGTSSSSGISIIDAPLP